METRVSEKMRDMEKRPFSDLSDDLLVEIISRVPFKSTCCCKCVCRQWCDVVSHPDHRKKLPGSTLAGYFYQTGNLRCELMNRHYESLTGNWCPDIDPSLSFLPKYKLCDIHIDMLDCCNGLLLCRRQETDHDKTTDYVVCNPATKRWVAVPGSEWSRKVRVARLGFDLTISSHFHVLEFALVADTHAKPLGIYSSKAGVWTHPTDWECPIDMDNFSGSTYLRGELYLSSYEGKVIAAIDMEGNCRAIPIPTSHDSCMADAVYASQEHLYLAISSASELSIWVLGNSDWTLKHNLSRLQLFRADYPRRYAWTANFIIHPDNNVIHIFYRNFHGLHRLLTKVMSYDMDSRELRSIRILGYDCRGPYLSYVPLFSHSPVDGH